MKIQLVTLIITLIYHTGATATIVPQNILLNCPDDINLVIRTGTTQSDTYMVLQGKFKLQLVSTDFPSDDTMELKFSNHMYDIRTFFDVRTGRFSVYDKSIPGWSECRTTSLN